MSPELELYYKGLSMRSIAGRSGLSPRYMKNKLRKERVKLGLGPRDSFVTLSDDQREFVADKEIVLELLSGGISLSDIANKYDLDRKFVSRYVDKWGWVRSSDKESIDTWTLTELYKGWSEAPKKLIININKKPTFMLVRI